MQRRCQRGHEAAEGVALARPGRAPSRCRCRRSPWSRRAPRVRRWPASAVPGDDRIERAIELVNEPRLLGRLVTVAKACTPWARAVGDQGEVLGTGAHRAVGADRVPVAVDLVEGVRRQGGVERARGAREPGRHALVAAALRGVQPAGERCTARCGGGWRGRPRPARQQQRGDEHEDEQRAIAGGRPAGGRPAGGRLGGGLGRRTGGESGGGPGCGPVGASGCGRRRRVADRPADRVADRPADRVADRPAAAVGWCARVRTPCRVSVAARRIRGPGSSSPAKRRTARR